MDERVLVFEVVCIHGRDASPEQQKDMTVSNDQMYFEQILRMHIEEKVKEKAFEKSPD